jgi:glycosyltransferase involved in cell wall biosynthesis
MTLRVGVVAGRRWATDGGAGTLTGALYRALKQAKTKHEFLILDDDSAARNFADESGLAAGAAAEQAAHRSYGQSVARKILPTRMRNIIANRRARAGYPDPLQAAIHRQKPDLVWSMVPASAPLPIPYITTVWDLEHRKQPYFPEVSVTGWTWAEREACYRSVLPRASFVITGTQVGKSEIVHYYGINPHNVQVVPFPIPDEDLSRSALDVESLRRKYRFQGDFLLYPAQHWPHKNHVNLLLALDILRKRDGHRLNLVLTGGDKGNRDFVHEKIRELDLSDQVFDLGFISREELSALYKNALALAYPTFFGPDNMPPLEAFSLGCPVAASRIAGAEEQLGSGALLFDPADPADIADKILALKSDAALRKRLMEEGARIARLRTPEGYIARIDEILDGFAAIRRCWGSDYRHT